MLKNKLLQAATENISAEAQNPEVFERLVRAGTKIIYNKKVFHQLAGELRKSKDPAGDVARGMVVVLGIMAHRARGTLDKGMLVQAGMILVLDALDFLEQAGLIKVNEALLDKATEEYIEALLPQVGLTHEKIQVVLDEIRQVMSDPQKMAEYQQSLGAAQ